MDNSVIGESSSPIDLLLGKTTINEGTKRSLEAWWYYE
ncbi:hypothetical protein bcere0012_51180 [Bacillus cereus BDRD-ST24]|nr:hypothetical protein bcere0012_51180 [Bacillus cereus BDRD-ST24]